MIRFAKYNIQPGIDVCYDNSYRFNLKWDASDALKNRTERLHRDLTRDFDCGYSKNRANLATQHYLSELRKYKIEVDSDKLSIKIKEIFYKCTMDSFKISLSKLREQSEISKGYNGLYKYELPMNLIEEYKRLYYQILGNFYEEVYQYIINTYANKTIKNI